MGSSADLTVFFDGGVAPNPGPILIAIVYGEEALLRWSDGLVGGNNEAEFRAALAALDYATFRELTQPTLAGDSDAVVSALGGRRPPRPGRLTELYNECLAKDLALGGVIWQQVTRSNPAGRLIEVQRRAERASRRRLARQAKAAPSTL